MIARTLPEVRVVLGGCFGGRDLPQWRVLHVRSEECCQEYSHTCCCNPVYRAGGGSSPFEWCIGSFVILRIGVRRRMLGGRVRSPPQVREYADDLSRLGRDRKAVATDRLDRTRVKHARNHPHVLSYRPHICPTLTHGLKSKRLGQVELPA